MSPDLRTTYLGLPLSGPVIASAGPLTGRLEDLLRLEDAGAAAVVLPSLFEEEVIDEELLLDEHLEQGTNSYAESVDYFPVLPELELGAERHLRLLGEAKERLGIPVIASLNAVHPGSWERYAGEFVAAGADAVELNLYSMATDPTRDAATVEAGYLEVIAGVRKAVNVPLAVKLSPYLSSTAHFAAAAVATGVDGLVLFNRFYTPDLDLSTFGVAPRLELSTSADLRLPLRWIGVLRPQLPATSLAATSGVHAAEDVAKALLVGANVACMTSALIKKGPQHLRTVLDGLESWMEGSLYASVAEMRGSASAAGVADPGGFERAQYVRLLTDARRR
ncbi:MAG TPA: dihydroorotate dehydrogenase-like protein [Kineosporiaceae bacterium]